MKITSYLKTCGVVLALASATHAADVIWEHGFHNAPLDFLNKDDKNYSNTFDLKFDGYIAGTNIDSAFAYFEFADDSSDSSEERVDISLDGTVMRNNIEVDGSHSNPPTSYDRITIELNDDLIAALEQNGTLDFLVALDFTNFSYHNKKYNDVYLKTAHLVATGSTTPPANVPDGGATAALLGLALVGGAALRRRLR